MNIRYIEPFSKKKTKIVRNDNKINNYDKFTDKSDIFSNISKIKKNKDNEILKSKKLLMGIDDLRIEYIKQSKYRRKKYNNNLFSDNHIVFNVDKKKKIPNKNKKNNRLEHLMKKKPEYIYDKKLCLKNLENCIIRIPLPNIGSNCDNKIIQVKIYSNLSKNINIQMCVDDILVPSSNILLSREWITINYIDINIFKNAKYVTIESDEVINIRGIYCNIIENKIITDNINLSCSLSNKIKTYKKTKVNNFKIGVIADVFTYENLDYIFDIIYVPPDFDFNKNKIDLLFCESVWGGLDESWRDIIFDYNEKDTKLIRIINECNKRNIPTVYYSKEDPLFFKQFRKCSNLFDLVITIAEECVVKYKEYGCKNVISTTFLANPIIHNPIKEVDNTILTFPGSYYNFIQNRVNVMEKILDNINCNFNIYDRKYQHNKATNQIKKLEINKNKCKYPNKYDKYINPGLTYNQVVEHVYKRSRCILNINSITNSKTMFSRRVMEVAACGTNIISNNSIGMYRIFKNNICYLTEKNNYNANINLDKMSTINVKLYELVHQKYTYKHLFDRIFNKLDMNVDIYDKICIFTKHDIKMDNRIGAEYTIIYDKIPKIFDWVIFLMNNKYYYDFEFINKLILPIEYVDDHIVISRNNSEFVFNNDQIFYDSYILNYKGKENRGNIENILKSNFSINNIYNPLREDYFDYYKYLPEKINKEIIKEDNLETIPIIICMWNRIERFDDIIDDLNNQIYSNFHLYIWNNNINYNDDLLELISEKKQKFNISWYNCDENIGGIGRFIMTKYLLNSKKCPYVIFMDDDQHIGNSVIKDLIEIKKKNTSYHWSGRKFYRRKNYWDGWSNIYSTDGKYYERLDYGGTGIMVIDTKVFNDETFYYLNRRYIFIEDLWLSYYSQKYHDYDIYNYSKLDVKMILDNKDQSLENEMIDLKNKFLNTLRRYGEWDV